MWIYTNWEFLSLILLQRIIFVSAVAILAARINSGHTSPMRWTSSAISMLACAILLTFSVVMWLILPQGAPLYKGLPLRDRVNAGYGKLSTPEQVEQANEAVRAVGTNALDFWVDMLGSTNDTKVNDIWNSFFDQRSRLHHADASERCSLAFCALYILGADAKPAIPKLTELLNCRYTWPNACATVILAGLGQDGVKTITNALADTNAHMRFLIAGTLGSWNGKPPDFVARAKRGEGPWEWPEPVMDAIIPALVRCLRDPDDDVRGFSAQSLGFLAKDAPTCVPALTEYLAGETNMVGRVTGLSALAKFGPAAKPAGPAITRLLEDSDFQTRQFATNALEKIGLKSGMK